MPQTRPVEGALVDDLLKISRISRMEVQPAPVDLSALASAVAAACQAESPGRPVEVCIEPGLAAYGDAGLLRALLENLLGNAFKYTGQQPAARIEVAAVPQANGTTAIVVRDNGVGFDMRYAGRLFTPFQRLHGAGEFPGTGIGLATAQRIVHKHGGKIWAEAAPGEGAAFYVSLPRPT